VKRIEELLAKLDEQGSLPADELTELQGLIRAEAEGLADADATPEVADQLEALASALDKADAEKVRQDTETAEVTGRRDAALARLRPADDETPDSDDAEAVDEPAVEVEEPQPIAASSAPTAKPAARRVNLSRASARAPKPDAPAPARANVTYTTPMGRAVDEGNLRTEFGRALQRAAKSAQGREFRADTTLDTVITASVEFPTDRILSLNADVNDDRVRSLLAAHGTPEAIVAAGGLCAPITNLYEVATIGTADRPVRDSFPSMGADRGGVSLRGPVLPGDMAGAVGDWTLTNDIDASTAGAPDPTKAYAVAVCSSFTDYFVEATTQIVEFNNVTTMYDPEQTAAVIDATDIAFAIKAENKLITKLNGFLTPVTTPKVVGAIPDILAGFDRTLAWWKTRRRLSDSQRFHVIGPRWARDLMRADLVRALMFKGTAGDPYALADSIIDGWFAARNLRVTWHLDGRSTAQSATTGVPAIAAQAYAGGSLTAAAAVPEFPDTIEWQVMLEGDVLLLDGGMINLGTVRDSTLNSTNKYRTFREEFFGLAWRGADGLQLVQTVDPTGIYAGWIDTSSTSD